MKTLPPHGLLLGLLLTWHSEQAAGAEDIQDLLQARWYEIEMIVFERLNVLDVNTAEQLTQRHVRTWPDNLLVLSKPSSGERTTSPISDMLVESERFCLGYPELPEEDPLHPLLQPPDETAFIEELPQQTDTEYEASATDLPAAESAPELSSPEPVPTPQEQFLAAVEEFETGLYASSYTTLTRLTMEGDVKALNRQSHIRPLMHLRWRAPIPNREEPQPVYLASAATDKAPRTREGFSKLEGYVTVTVGRYLHFAPTLWYHADNLGLEPVSFPAGENLSVPEDPRFMELQESRRMRSGEVHYLDHPKLGVIVRIDPVEIPPHLEQAPTASDDI